MTRPQHRTEDEYTQAVTHYSNAIRVSRVLCIAFMAYVHVHLFTSPAAHSPLFQSVQALLSDLLGRSSVPLLSVISGGLMVGWFRRRTFTEAAKRRALSLLLPLLTWGALTLLFERLRGQEVSLLSLATPGLQEHGMHLSFLRDIFVVSLATPILTRAVRRWPLLTALATLGAVYLGLEPVVLRAQILFYFVVGIYLAEYKWEHWLPARSLVVLAAVAMAALAVSALAKPFVPGLSALFENAWVDALLRRPVCALFFWAVALRAANTRFGVAMRAIEPAIFVMFLSHVLSGLVLVSVFAAGWQYLQQFLPAPGVFYMLLWLLTVPLCLGIAIVIKALLSRAPRAVAFLAEGRG